MGIFAVFRRRRKAPYRSVTEEEAASRYVYLLNSLPASVIESAHATAFADVPEAKRREMFEKLRPFLAESERDAASPEPVLLARLVRRAEERRASSEREQREPAATRTSVLDPVGDPADPVDPRQTMLSIGILGAVAQSFLLSAALTSYFTVGAGSLTLDGEPGWVADTFDPGAGGGFDGGGYDGGGSGGFDGGGFGGGFDGGGFGGGFDGGSF